MGDVILRRTPPNLRRFFPALGCLAGIGFVVWLGFVIQKEVEQDRQRKAYQAWQQSPQAALAVPSDDIRLTSDGFRVRTFSFDLGTEDPVAAGKKPFSGISHENHRWQLTWHVRPRQPHVYHAAGFPPYLIDSKNEWTGIPNWSATFWLQGTVPGQRVEFALFDLDSRNASPFATNLETAGAKVKLFTLPAETSDPFDARRKPCVILLPRFSNGTPHRVALDIASSPSADLIIWSAISREFTVPKGERLALTSDKPVDFWSFQSERKLPNSLQKVLGEPLAFWLQGTVAEQKVTITLTDLDHGTR